MLKQSSGRNGWLALAVAGLVIAVGVPLGWSLADHPSGAHQINPGAAASIAAAPTEARLPAAHVTTAASPAAPAATSAGPTARPATNAVPTRLRIPSLQIDAEIVPVGVDGRGEMQIPAQISQIGWYQWGPAPGTPTGSIVLAGHVDSAVEGLGSFFDLHNVQAGATVTVTMTGGATKRYRVIGREEFPKTTVPLAKLFSRSGPQRLTLITCGGGFDRSARSYYDNVVVTAVPT